MNLYISCEKNVSWDVLAYVKTIDWKYGDYEIIIQREQLGVDQHNITCMSMAEKLDHVVILEDDLIVSPAFQEYLLKAYELIKAEKMMAGLSLYRYPIREANRFPFELIPNNEFVYYQQRASSKGCFYTWEMVKPYLQFIETFDNDYSEFHLPQNVLKWDNMVWEKSFYAYLQDSGKYLGFPRYSLTSDFADVGVHMKKQVHKYQHQSQLYLSNNFMEFKRLRDTENVYDAFYELDANVVKKLNPKLESLSLELDLYGTKDLSKIKADYIISERKTSQMKQSWARSLKPEINNIICNYSGDFYKLAATKSFSNKKPRQKLKENFLYYYPDTRLTDLVRMKFKEVFSRFT
jgi:hypothetical protein